MYVLVDVNLYLNEEKIRLTEEKEEKERINETNVGVHGTTYLYRFCL